MGRSGTRSSGEVEGVVDFREEEAVLVRSLEDEAPDADSRSDRFPDEGGEVREGDLGFRDVVEMGDSVESGRREVALVSVAPVEKTRLVGSAVGRALGRGGNLGVAFVRGLVILLTCSGSSASVFAGRGSAPGFIAGGSGRTGFLQSLGSSRSTWMFSGRRRKHL